MLFGEFIEDVTSISWIFIIFACFIALIEVWRYIMNVNKITDTPKLEPDSKTPKAKRGSSKANL